MSLPSNPPDETPTDRRDPLTDEDRPIDTALDEDALPGQLDVRAETPVPDVVDQRRAIAVDDDAYR